MEYAENGSVSDTLHNFFEANDDEYLKFSRIEAPAHCTPDICAFIMLTRLDTDHSDRDMVACAEHDEIWLRADPETVWLNATPDDLLNLLRCGVLYDESTESFRMNV